MPSCLAGDRCWNAPHAWQAGWLTAAQFDGANLHPGQTARLTLAPQSVYGNSANATARFVPTWAPSAAPLFVSYRTSAGVDAFLNPVLQVRTRGPSRGPGGHLCCRRHARCRLDAPVSPHTSPLCPPALPQNKVLLHMANISGATDAQFTYFGAALGGEPRQRAQLGTTRTRHPGLRPWLETLA